MASAQRLATLPPLTLDAGCTVTFEAINPTTGAAVTGVLITLAAVYATNVVNGVTAVDRAPLFALEPLDV